MDSAATVAALYVDPNGVYANLPGVEVWDEARDARPPILPGITKKDAALRIAVVAAEIRLAIDERDEDAPSWADHLDLIAEALHP